jgi:hypothetical protein
LALLACQASHVRLIEQVLEAGTAKINNYYQKTADSDAYTFAMHMFFISVYPTLKLTYASPCSNAKGKSYQEILGKGSLQSNHKRSRGFHEFNHLSFIMALLT